MGLIQSLTGRLNKTPLVHAVDYAKFISGIVRNRPINQRFLAEHPGFVPPPYHLAYDAYNNTNWRAYYDTGRIHAHLIANMINEYVSAETLTIYEWGCGPARVIRHLGDLIDAKEVTLHGTDVNEQSIAWCQQHVSGISFETNPFAPPLHFSAESIDCRLRYFDLYASLPSDALCLD